MLFELYELIIHGILTTFRFKTSGDDPTWKPKQMVGTTLNIEAQELTLKNTQTFTDTQKTIAVANTDMHPLKPVLLTLGCALELL